MPLAKTTSIQSRLVVVFVFLLAVVAMVGMEGLRSLRLVEEAAAEIRLRWLPSTHALGDLNNFTTDFPLAEAARQRAEFINERTTIDAQMASLDRGIDSAQTAYRHIRRDAVEEGVYRQFVQDWNHYRRLIGVGQSTPPALESETDAYRAASKSLAKLTEMNARGERDAIARSDLAFHRARRHIALLLLFAALLVIAATLYVSRSVSAPLAALAHRMRQLASSEYPTGARGADVSGAGRHDEIGDMARAVAVFRDNAVDLAVSRRALAEQAGKLQEKLEEEQKLLRLQRNLVSMASHEFGTPLAIIDGHAQRLESMRERLDVSELVERARKVRGAVQRLTQLINNLVGSAQLTDGRIGLTFRPVSVDLGKLIVETCAVQRELTPEVRLSEKPRSSPVVVYGDPSLLSQAIGNLLSNAVKYSPQNAAIEVDCWRHEAHVMIKVEDRGIGVPATDRPRLFESYFRGSNTSGIVGSGVGLYLVQAIAELHDGNVWHEPREGGGSRFLLRFLHEPDDSQSKSHRVSA